MVSVGDKTTYKKLAPGEQTLTNATDTTFAEITEGDRIMARGTVSETASRCLRHRSS
jgi:hypothetical protein